MVSDGDKLQAGRVKEITSVSNPIIKSIKSLALKKNRDRDQVFIAEGLKLITDALECGWQIQTLIYAKNIADQEHLRQISAKIYATGGDILEVSEKVLGSITRRDNPQMVVGIFKQKWMDLAQISGEKNQTWVALDRVRDPGNLGTIIRTADAAGASGIILIGETTDPWSIEAVRATMGSIFNIKIARTSEEVFLDWRNKWNGLVIGTHLEGAIDYRDVDYMDQPILLLMGNEQQGLPQTLVDACTHKVLIPMAGKADSLNLAISTGVMLFEIRKAALNMPAAK